MSPPTATPLKPSAHVDFDGLHNSAREGRQTSHHFLGALMDVSTNMDPVPLAIPSLLHFIPVLQFHSGNIIVDGTQTLHRSVRVHKPFVRIA